MYLYIVLLLLVLIPIAIYDIKTQIIENWPLLIILALGILNLIFQWINITFTEALLSGLFAGLFFYILAYFGMGGGDVKLIAALGFAMGKTIISSIWLSFCVGAIFAIIMIAFKKYTAKNYLPFAPFIAIGTILSFFIKINI